MFRTGFPRGLLSLAIGLGMLAGAIAGEKTDAALAKDPLTKLIGRAFELTRDDKLPVNSNCMIFEEFSRADILALSRKAPLFPHRATVTFNIARLIRNTNGTIPLKMYEVNGRVAKALPPRAKDGIITSSVVMTPTSLISRIDCEADRPLTASEMAAMVAPTIRLVKERR